MAKRIGSEVVEHWTVGKAEFNKPRTPRLVAEYRGCWPNFISAEQDETQLTSVAGFWIPADFSPISGDDYLVWKRYPNEIYDIEGDVERVYTRRGQLRAVVARVEKRKGARA